MNRAVVSDKKKKYSAKLLVPLPDIADKGEEISSTFDRILSLGNVFHANSHEKTFDVLHGLK